MLHQRLRHALTSMVALGFVACTDSSPEDNSPGDHSGHSEHAYYSTVAPLLEQNCVSCHQAGAVASIYPLGTYAQAKSLAALIKPAVAERRMPPWGAVSDDTCGEWQHSRWLSEADIKTITDWVDHGTPEGDASDFTAQGPPTTLGIEGPVTSIKTLEAYSPAALGGPVAAFDDYRCNLVENPFNNETRFITATDVRPGNEAIVHHVLALLVPLDELADTRDRDNPTDATTGLTNRELISVLSAADDEAGAVRPGWPCFNEAGSVAEYVGGGYAKYDQANLPPDFATLPQADQITAVQTAAFVRLATIAGAQTGGTKTLTPNDVVGVRGLPVVWAPGTNAVILPEGTGIIVPGNMAIVLQTHYNLYGQAAGAALEDTTEVVFQVTDSVERVATITLLDQMLRNAFTDPTNGFVIPKGHAGPDNLFRESWDLSSARIAGSFGAPVEVLDQAELLGLFPHMHEAGREMTLTYTSAPGEAGVCAIQVDQWDFNWQLSYYFDQPMPLASTGSFELECAWDTTNHTEDIHPGWGTRNEMCLMGFITSVPANCLGGACLNP